ncbi:MAG: hypothetical protein ACQESF_05350 [Nanobdellota archaeon]
MNKKLEEICDYVKLEKISSPKIELYICTYQDKCKYQSSLLEDNFCKKAYNLKPDKKINYKL